MGKYTAYLGVYSNIYFPNKAISTPQNCLASQLKSILVTWVLTGH